MKGQLVPRRSIGLAILSLGLLVLGVQPGYAENRLKRLPGWENYSSKRPQQKGEIKLGRIESRWLDNDRLAVKESNKWYVIDPKTKKKDPMEGDPPVAYGGKTSPNDARRRPDRGRQFTETFSEKGELKAFFKLGNVYLSKANGSEERSVTTDGDPAKRVQYGTATWVYGEELGQVEAMGFSPDGKFLWFYRMDTRPTPDFYIAMNQTQVQDALDVEPYAKAGAPNPVPDLFIYDVETRKTAQVKVRSGEFGDNMGHYVYGMEWSPDGKELFFHRTNRLQNDNEFVAADPKTGQIRVITRETYPKGWVDAAPTRVYLDKDPQIDKKPKYRGKAIWAKEDSGYRNLVLLDLAKGTTTQITNNKYDLLRIVRVDLDKETLYYVSADGDNPYKQQLHRVKLDGTGDVKMTDPKLHHDANVSPNGAYFVDVSEAIDVPPATTLRDASGKEIMVLASSQVGKLEELGYDKRERFEFLSADGVTKLYGTYRKPPDFDPNKKYPVLLDVYGGPDSGGLSERYTRPTKQQDFGFIQVNIAGRGTTDRGKEFKNVVYGKLGTLEIDDQAAGIKALTKLPFVDGTKVAVTGTSYGGYASIMCILRHPDVFQAAVACSSVTAWDNYDSTYTERYMSTPQLNPEGYKAGSAMTYAKDLKGKLMLYWGTADNNVHPSNTMQLVNELHKRGKTFHLMCAPDRGHVGMDWRQVMEFFLESLGVTGKE